MRFEANQHPDLGAKRIVKSYALIPIYLDVDNVWVWLEPYFKVQEYENVYDWGIMWVTKRRSLALPC